MKNNILSRTIVQANLFFLTILISFSFLHSMEDNTCFMPEMTVIIGENIDEIILKGIKNIKENGELFEARAGSGQQAYDVNYVLLNPLNRVHLLRKNPFLKNIFAENF